MHRMFRSHMTYANVMATIAVFLVLSGGTAVALNGANTVFTDDIANDTQPAGGGNPAGGLAAPDLRAGSVGSSEVAANSLAGGDINEANLDATPLRTRVAQGGCSPSVAGTGVMVKAGSVCIDKYEASVWSSPTGGNQYGVTSDDYPCNDDGQNCTNIYARSVAGVKPSGRITYFQAQQALANSGKRLPTNAEWQQAVAGTPDLACNISTGSVANTGANDACVSNWGASDMVGNLSEWVGDWVPASTNCPGWGAFSEDIMCLSGASTMKQGPGALRRGGHLDYAGFAGPFAVEGTDRPSDSAISFGFRGAR